MQWTSPLFQFCIRHPVVIPPIDKLDHTDELKKKKDPAVHFPQIKIFIVYCSGMW